MSERVNSTANAWEVNGCSAADPPCSFVTLISYGKYLAPRERSEVFTAVRARFRTSGEAPLERIAWQVLERRNGWVALQHVGTGKLLRLVAPPSPIQWTLLLDRQSGLPREKETWFKLETGSEPGLVHVRNRATGGFINFRFDDILRGHDSQPSRGGSWRAAPQLSTTKMRVERLSLEGGAATQTQDPCLKPGAQPTLSLSAYQHCRAVMRSDCFAVADMRADAQKWEARRLECLRPAVSPDSPSDWNDACYKHFAAEYCVSAMRRHDIRPGGSWGSAQFRTKLRWARVDCTPNYATGEEYAWVQATRQQTPPPVLPAPAPRSRQRFDPQQCHCTPAVDGMVVLAVVRAQCGSTLSWALSLPMHWPDPSHPTAHVISGSSRPAAGPTSSHLLGHPSP